VEAGREVLGGAEGGGEVLVGGLAQEGAAEAAVGVQAVGELAGSGEGVLEVGAGGLGEEELSEAAVGAEALGGLAGVGEGLLEVGAWGFGEEEAAERALGLGELVASAWAFLRVSARSAWLCLPSRRCPSAPWSGSWRRSESWRRLWTVAARSS